MIRIYNETILQNQLNTSSSFRPAGVGFILIYGGTAQLEINQQPLRQLAQDLVVLSPGNVYQFPALSTDVRFYIVSFDRKELRQRINYSFNGYSSFRIMRGSGAPNTEVLKLPAQKFGYLLELCRQLEYHLANHSDYGFNNEIVTGLSSVIGFTIADEMFSRLQPAENRNLRKEQLTVQFFELVSQYAKEEKELKFYADKLCVSIKYLSNCVREVARQPPSRFIAEALVNEAKEQLLNTREPVYAVAEALKFSDQYAFGKFFKKHTGHSPLNFRKQNQRVDTI
ncbi:helix-turn-helix domain-containing protein [Hymenobacter actinosclerus]|uniref:Transcriptional regulator, AraC family n=1 Tax=Hymenobacter actinosclerus TaxID=82805 RepID=A0A1I0GQS0_9BACT|nr:helix-turn-helix domain-containing protein [Hymenobacter actinosclerus]SET73440.1 transcriptional regulator, AraC family [Hymenobacter actinosclerus]